MPSHELNNAAWCNEHQEGAGYTAQRGYTPAKPAPAAAPAADGLELLRRLVRAFAPTAVLQAYVLLEEDGVHPALRTYHVKLSGAEVRDAVKTQGISAEEVAKEAKRAWAKERRSTDIFRLVESCQRIVGGCLDEDFESQLIYEMQRCDFTAFKTQAAMWERKAVAYAKQDAAQYNQAA